MLDYAKFRGKANNATFHLSTSSFSRRRETFHKEMCTSCKNLEIHFKTHVGTVERWYIAKVKSRQRFKVMFVIRMSVGYCVLWQKPRLLSQSFVNIQVIYERSWMIDIEIMSRWRQGDSCCDGTSSSKREKNGLATGRPKMGYCIAVLAANTIIWTLSYSLRGGISDMRCIFAFILRFIIHGNDSLQKVL